jgi:archaetidylinositol phosphate synthase
VTPVERIQQNLLARSERRLLNWLCARLPKWVKPDLLTTIGFLGAVTSSAGYVLSNWSPLWLWLAISGYFINWFGDSLDGSLARFRGIERPTFGYFIDHSTDSIANLILVAGIGFSPYVRLDVALFGIAAYLLLSIHTFLAARVVGEFRLSYVAAGPTELRLLLIAMTLCMLWLGPQAIGATPFTVFDAFIGALAAIMIVLYVVQTAVTARKLAARYKKGSGE